MPSTVEAVALLVRVFTAWAVLSALLWLGLWVDSWREG